METLLQLMGDQLSESQYASINASSLREFGVALPPRPEMSSRRYFLLTEYQTRNILASGFLKPIHPVIFDRETYSFLNIGGIIANEKGKGFGKKVMAAIRTHLIANDQTGLGFCWPNNQGFYEKCGFRVETHSTQRFIYQRGEERLTAEGQYILYLDSNDGFMQKVLSNADQEVFVPDPGIW